MGDLRRVVDLLGATAALGPVGFARNRLLGSARDRLVGRFGRWLGLRRLVGDGFRPGPEIFGRLTRLWTTAGFWLRFLDLLGVGRRGFVDDYRPGNRRFVDADHFGLAAIAPPTTATAAAATATVASSALAIVSFGLGTNGGFLSLIACLVRSNVFANRLAGLAALDLLAVLALAIAAATATAATPAALATFSIAVIVALVAPGVGPVADFLLFLILVGIDLGVDLIIVIALVENRGGDALRSDRQAAAALDRHARAFEGLVDYHFQGHPVASLDFAELPALLVEQVNRRLAPGAKYDPVAPPTRRFFLNDPKRAQSRRRCGTHQPGALAMRTWLGRGFEHAGAQALAAHLHQAEA